MIVFGGEYTALRKLGFSRAESTILLLGEAVRSCTDFHVETTELIRLIQFEEERIFNCTDSIDKKIYQIMLELLEVMFKVSLEKDMKIVEEKYGVVISGVEG